MFQCLLSLTPAGEPGVSHKRKLRCAYNSCISAFHPRYTEVELKLHTPEREAKNVLLSHSSHRWENVFESCRQIFLSAHPQPLNERHNRPVGL